MNFLNVDIETFSCCPLKQEGVFKYVAHPSFEILLFACSIDGDPVQVYDLTKEKLPAEILHKLTSPEYKKTAWNAAFEICCINKYFNIRMPKTQWECTMVKAAVLSLPMSLDQAGSVLQLSLQKDKIGGAHLRYFCMPCKPTKTNGGRIRNMPADAPTKWEEFKHYVKRDVEAEQEIHKRLSRFKIPEHEQQLWELDQEINDRGVQVDKSLVENAMRMDAIMTERLTKEAIEITGLKNPNSLKQLKEWLTEETDEEIETLTKKTIPVLLAKEISGDAERVLQIRQEMGKTSIQKYYALDRCAMADDRVRGLAQFYGARTGRWSSRLFQFHNLPKHELNAEDIGLARQLLLENDLDSMEFCYGNVPRTLSELVRTALVPKKGHKFVIADFSAIEARVIAWFAGEQWRMAFFKQGGDIYKVSASLMFSVPIEKVDKELRAKGKVSELACGYQGSVGAIRRMDTKEALKHLTDLEVKETIVNPWRAANPNIVQLWWDMGNAAIRAVRDRVLTECAGIRFYVSCNILFMRLLSGRSLAYIAPRIEVDSEGREGLTYMGVDQLTKKWGRIRTYGGRWVENLCQSVARDCLAVAMTKISKRYDIVFHVHDEVVLEVPEDDEQALPWTLGIMGEEISWAPGMLLGAAGFEMLYYKKD